MKPETREFCRIALVKAIEDLLDDPPGVLNPSEVSANKYVENLINLAVDLGLNYYELANEAAEFQNVDEINALLDTPYQFAPYAPLAKVVEPDKVFLLNFVDLKGDSVEIIVKAADELSAKRKGIKFYCNSLKEKRTTRDFSLFVKEIKFQDDIVIIKG